MNAHGTTSERLAPPAFHSRWHVLRALRRVLEESAARLPRGDLFVDLGCGGMPYRSIFERTSARYVGADLPRNAAADVHLDDAGRAPLADGSADVVLSSQVLEHVLSPREYLDEAHRLLKPGGLLLLSTHGYWMYHPDPTDFWRWTRDGLVRQIEDCGFSVRSVTGVMNLAAAGLQLFQDGVSGRVPRLLRPPFYFMMNRAMALVDRLGGQRGRDRDASVYVVLAERTARPS